MTPTLSLNENDFKDILNGLVDGVITINHKGIILSFNTTAETMFGYKAEDVIGNNVSMLMPVAVGRVHDSYINNYVSTGIEKIIGIGRDVTAQRKNGETFPMHLSVVEYPAKIEGDRWFIGSCRDITLQKQQEEQLRRSLKMDAIGKLTSGIAHDYNNMLGVIMGYTELLSNQESVNNDPKLSGYINSIEYALERATNLTQQLMSISRKRNHLAEACNINEILKNNQDILAKTLTPQIKLSINFENDLWPVLIDKSSLIDAILNLSINAMHAMPEGGKLDIVTSNVQIDFLNAQVLDITPGDYVKVTITDSGIGMTADVVSHIFEPFYSTKGEKGTGLGLSQVYNFVIESKGTIRVYSEPSHGTCFSIYLPIKKNGHSTLEANDIVEINDDELCGSERILVVDDEPALRELSESILSSHGYTVFSAADANEALSKLETEKIDLMISDVIMPGMDGYELAFITKNRYPNIKVQLCSGFAGNRGKAVTGDALSKNLLEKPYTSKQLLIKVKELLNGEER